MKAPFKRVVVTGVGCVTPLGNDLETTWRRLVAGESARAPITLFDVSGCRCKHGAQAILPELPEREGRKLKRWPRASRLAAPALREALANANLLNADGRARHSWLPLTIGTTGAAMALPEAFLRNLLGPRRRPRRLFNVARYQAHQQLLDLQEYFGFRGPVTIISNACASGANAIGHAADLIHNGLADLVVAGSYEALTELIFVGFDCLQALSPDICRPFDIRRNGLMLGEGAGFLVLESEEYAQARGAEILCELAGYGFGTDPYHLTQPNPRGTVELEVMRQALAQAGLAPRDIDYLNAHGTATALNDASECAAFVELFGTDSARVRISSTKAAIGHTLGAAGCLEALFAIQALRTGQLPPSVNVERPEPVVAGRLVNIGEKVPTPNATMSVNVGFGGSNAAVLFVRYKPKSVDSYVTAPSRADNFVPHPVCRREPRLESPLGICGVGAVFPAEGVQWISSVEGRDHPARRVDLTQPTLQSLCSEPRLRRASPITGFMLGAAQQALMQAGPVDRAGLGLVVTLHTGMIVATRRFFEGLVKDGQRFASPNLFPETVFNSAASHVAAVLGVTGLCYTLLGDDSAWLSGLRVAGCWLAKGLVEHALVIGAEEFDPLELDAYAQARWLRLDRRFKPSEGAGALLLRRARPTDPAQVTALAEGFTYRDIRQARQAAEEMLAHFPGTREVSRTAEHKWLGKLEAELHQRHGLIAQVSSNGLGEAFVASAAWDTIRAVDWVKAERKPLLVPIWGQSGQCSALLLTAPLGK
jgi:3-oxoacyl-[acyl-carrier-protein] synthase II